MSEQKHDPKYVAIIGAGVTGLSAAYHLQQAGHNVIVLEKSARIGGAIQTTIKDEFLCEHGPNSLMLGDKRVSELITRIGLSSSLLQANSAADKRFIVHEGKLTPLPHSLLSGLTSPLFSLKAKFRLLKEPFIPKRNPEGGGECFADFVRRRLGPEMLEKAAGPFVSGIYAGDPNRLSITHAFPRLHRLEQNYGSLVRGAIKLQRSVRKGTADPNRLAKREIVSFTNGMQQLTDSLAASLAEGTIFNHADIGGISQNKKSKRWHIDWKCANGSIGQGSFTDVIVTVPSHKLEELPFEEQLHDSVSKLTHLDYPPVSSMLLGFKRSDVKHALDGFGMLMSMSEKSKILGGLFTSTLFPGRAPDEHVAINIMLGGARTPEHANMSDSAMKASVMDELRRLLGIETTPVFTHLTRWKKAIPQLNLGYSAILEQIQQSERESPGIHFAGNYRGGISVGDCIVSGAELSQQISSSN